MKGPQNPSPASANSATEAAVRKWIEGMVAKSPAAGSMDAWNGELFDAIPLSGLRLTFTGGGRALCSYVVHASVAVKNLPNPNSVILHRSLIFYHITLIPNIELCSGDVRTKRGIGIWGRSRR